MSRRATLALGIVLASSSCSSRTATLVPDGSGSPVDGLRPDLWRPPRDGERAPEARPPDAKAVRDALSDPLWEYCACTACTPPNVWLTGSCVATDKLFTCGEPCDLQASTACSFGYDCVPNSATPCCNCSALVSACVPISAPPGQLQGPLRIDPVSGPAGQKVTLTINGAPFFYGGLYYSARMGSQTVSDNGAGDPDCRLSATFAPPAPGIYPVEVSQYGGGPPWVLAGFFTATGGGVAPMASIQPGYWCSMSPKPGDPPCLAAPPYVCGCFGGRCVCK